MGDLASPFTEAAGNVGFGGKRTIPLGASASFYLLPLTRVSSILHMRAQQAPSEQLY
jgi:hypothetical protein